MEILKTRNWMPHHSWAAYIWAEANRTRLKLILYKQIEHWQFMVDAFPENNEFKIQLELSKKQISK